MSKSDTFQSNIRRTRADLGIIIDSSTALRKHETVTTFKTNGGIRYGTQMVAQ